MHRRFYIETLDSLYDYVFNSAKTVLKEILILDGIDLLPNGFRIRCHDLHCALPEIAIENSGNTLQDKDWPPNESCKIIAIVKLREEMLRFMR